MTSEERERTRRYVRRLDERYARLRDEVEEDVALTRGLSPEEIDRRMGALIHASWENLQGLPEDVRLRVLRPEPPSPDFAHLWRRLVERRQRERAGSRHG